MMRIIDLKTKSQVYSLSYPTVLCIGDFDGVHLGHRQLVYSVIDKYRDLKNSFENLSTGTWFFDNNPFKTDDEIFSIDEKLDTFASLGLDYAIVVDFNEVCNLSPKAFVDDILVKKCNSIHAVCGENFRFGAKAAGSSSDLMNLMNGNATVVPLLSEGSDNTVVSSTYIRSLLINGDIEKANCLLGSNYSIDEEVVHGKALGRTIGIPTINQNVTAKKLILKNGIYATLCHFDGKKYMGVTNIGVRPTVEDSNHKNVETYIIDFNGDCYGKSIKVEFISRIRDEMKFDSIEALKNQILKDIEETKRIFYDM